MKYYKKIKGDTYSNIKVSYALGGMNYFSGRGERRGIYIHFNFVDRKVCNGYTSESFMLFGDGSFKVLAMELKRKSSKQLRAVCEVVEDKLEELHQLHIDNNMAGVLLWTKQNFGE